VTVGAEADIAAWVGGACSLAASVGVVYLALASFLVMRFRPEERRVPSRCPPASILVPLCGEDSELRERAPGPLPAVLRRGAPARLRRV